MCCKVERCCFCIHHVLGVKVLGSLLIVAELLLIITTTLYLPRFLFAVAPTSSIGIFCDIFLLVAVYRGSRWFMLPWLIYIMIVIVGLGLAAVLQVVIPLGVPQTDWLLVVVGSAGCLAVAGLLLYFWIVVLELFIRLGPVYEGQVYATPTYPATAAATAYPLAAGAIPIQPYVGGYNQGPPSIIYQQQITQPFGAT